MGAIPVTAPGLTGASPVYTAVSASDYFDALPGQRYILHYKNGATLTGAGTFKVADSTTPIPAGSGLTAGFADLVVQNAGMAATTELISQLDQSSRFRAANGRITLSHTGTLTTVALLVMGPFPA